MAEYKTYTCDLCRKPESGHFVLPSVDTQDAGHGQENIPGTIDLCLGHVGVLIDAILRVGSLTTAQQREA